MLPTAILLYDDYCPLCTWYSGLFVKYRLLQPGNRLPFSQAPVEILSAIDMEKGKDEIPLFDPATGTTLYGIDALVEILGQKIPLVKIARRSSVLQWVLKRLYRFISFNRKLIVAKKCGQGRFDCSPRFDVRYRLLFLFVFLSFNSIMLLPVHQHLLSNLPVYHLTSPQLQAAHFVFVAINCFTCLFLERRQALEYLGQINVLATMAILAMVPLLFINAVVILPAPLIMFLLLLLAFFIIKEYFRRMNYASVLGRKDGIVAINCICLCGFLFYLFH